MQKLSTSTRIITKSSRYENIVQMIKSTSTKSKKDTKSFYWNVTWSKKCRRDKSIYFTGTWQKKIHSIIVGMITCDCNAGFTVSVHTGGRTFLRGVKASSCISLLTPISAPWSLLGPGHVMSNVFPEGSTYVIWDSGPETLQANFIYIFSGNFI